jgi:hypothetical protein
MYIPKPTSEAQRQLYRVRLEKAETAYDALMTGEAVRRTVDQNGEQVEFNTANASRLLAYISALREALKPATQRGHRPIGFTF